MKIYKITFENGAISGCAPLSPNTHIVRHWPHEDHFTLVRGRHITVHLSAEDFEMAMASGRKIYSAESAL